MRSNPTVLAILCAFLGGLTPVAAKVSLEVFPPFTLVLVRFSLATLFLLPFILHHHELSVNKLRQLGKIGLVGALNPVLLFIALPFTQAAISPLIYACTPALTIIYLFLTRGERITKKQAVGVVIGLFGVAIVILTPFLEKGIPLSAFTGNVLIFGAAIAFMLYGVISKRYQSHHKISPLALTFYFCLVTTLAMLPLSVWELATQPSLLATLSTGLRPAHILGALAMGILGSGMFYLVYQYAIAAGSELAANLFTYFQPIATISLAVLFLGETIGPAFIIGGILAIFGAQIARK